MHTGIAIATIGMTAWGLLIAAIAKAPQSALVAKLLVVLAQ